MASKDFDLCERVDTSIANELSGAAWEQMINPLLEWIVSQTADSDTLCTMLVRPYLYNFKTKAWQSVAWCLKYIDALKLMFKMAMFLKSRDEFLVLLAAARVWVLLLPSDDIRAVGTATEGGC